MIEAGLVYIHSDRESSGFAGCGALVEGPYIVTCRHVWDQALQAAGDGPVLVCFPPPQGKGEPVFEEAILIDTCDAADNQPDLVILKAEVPPASATLSVARARVAEIGPAAALAGLVGRDSRDRYAVRDIIIRGTIEAYVNSEGLCQFTGADGRSYWSDRGSSGSPLGLNDETALAGILCMSETGARPGEAGLHEAFVLPASTIHAFLRAHVGRTAAEARDIDAARMPKILDMLGAPDLSLAELRRRLDAYFASVEVLAEESVASERAEAAEPAKDGAADLAAALARSRALSARFEPAAAMAVLDDALVEEAWISRQRRLPLLAEKFKQQRLVLDHQGAIASLTEITTLEPDASWGWIGLGDTRRRIGSREAAFDAYRMGLRAADRANNQRDRSACQQRIGDLLVLEGDRAGALAAYRACLSIARQLLDAEPDNAAWRHDFAISQNRIGEVLRVEGDRAGALAAFQACLDIIESLALVTSGQTGLQQDLSVTHQRIGDVLLVAGNRSGALAAYRASLAIREVLAALDPMKPEWQQNLSTAHQRISDLLRRAGDLPGALAEARASLAIMRRIAEHDPHDTDFQRELCVSHNIVGFVLTLHNNPDGALEEYNAGLAIIQRLCARDPGQTGWQADLSTTHERIGGVLLARSDLPAALAAFRASLVIRRTLCVRDPANTEWQRELAVSHTKFGDTLREQANLDAEVGDTARARQTLDAALDSFQAALAILVPLAARDPDHAEWQRDVSVGHNKIGDTLLSQNDRAGALVAFRASFVTAERLADRDLDNADWQRDLLVSCVKMASVNPARPRPWFTRALAIATQLAQAGRLAPIDVWMISNLQRRLRDLPPDADPASGTPALPS